MTKSAGREMMRMKSTITPSIVREKLRAGESVVLLDVREPYELTGDLGHIDGVINIPIDGLEARIGEIEHARERDIVTICRSGGRATSAAKTLRRLGFERVYVMEGGTNAWRKEGYPVER
jgi:rhodanese-related sulfurtransferase